MTKIDTIRIIDDQLRNETDPMKLLNWSWLRVIINQIPNMAWERYVEKATIILAG